MPAQWTGKLIVKMHLNKVTRKSLAEEAGITPEYLSMILNGHRNPAGAEEKLTAALDRLVGSERG